jgi:hypothetical protein
VNPEAVQPRFLNDDDRERFSSPRKRLLLGKMRGVVKSFDAELAKRRSRMYAPEQ